MAGNTLNLRYDNSTDIIFKEWAKGLSDQLIAAGWTRTADTGQIDWTAITRPTVANTSQGYEIFQMNDVLQATAPIFLKVEYGSGGNILYPSIWLTAGVATSGAGALTGNITTRQQLQSGGNTTALQAHKFDGANNRFVCALAPEFNGAANMIAFGIERTHGDDGSDTDAGALFFGIGSGVKVQAPLPKAGTGASPATEGALGCMTPLSATSVRGTDIGLFPVFPFLGRMLNPYRNLMVYFNNEITANLTITATHYGLAHTFYTVGGSVGNFSRGTATDSANSRLAIRFD